MMHELKEAFLKKHQEAQGSRERMKSLADKCVLAYNEAEKRKSLGRPGIDPRMAAKRKKKHPAEQPEPSIQESPHIIFPSSMTGSKPKVTTTASEQKKMRAAEAEARKRKNIEASDAAPSKKKRKTKKTRAAPTEPLVVEPISVVRPASEHQERRMIVHEPASTEAHEAEDIPAVDPITAEDIGHHDNVEDDEVLPQIEHNVVSSPVLTNSELISIGRPLTPIAQEASWADHPQQRVTPPRQEEEDDFETQPTPSPKASPVLQRLRKGPRPQVPLPSVPEGEVHHQPVARQVFSEATPTVNVSVSEAQAAEDNPAASADDEHQEERVPTPPITEEVVPEVNMHVPDPPAQQVEVENVEAATTNTNEANDVVMAEANVEPAPSNMPEVNAATAPEASVVQPEATVAATAPVPPPRPYTIEQAYNHGELITVRWPVLVPPPNVSGP